MKLIKFEDFLQLVDFFSKTLGIKAYDKPGTRDTNNANLHLILPLLILFDILLALICEIFFIVISLKSGEHILEAITTLTYLGFGIVSSCKIITIFSKKSQLCELIFELHSLFPTTFSAQNDMKMNNFLRQCTFTSTLYATINMMLTWSYNLGPILSWLIFGVEQKLPYHMKIPWDWRNHWSYYFIYAAQVLAAYSSTAGQILSDLLIMALSTQVIMHYDNVARVISSLKINADELEKTNLEHVKQHKKDLSYLKDIIAYHERVLRLSQIMNDVFGVPLLINFLTSTVVICFVGFQMTVGESNFNTMMKLFFFMSTSLSQVFLICQYGQQLIDSSTNISGAVFAHDWYNADEKYKKLLRLMIARAQKPATLKATIFVDVSRNTMAGLMKVSYNFFTLLRTTYVE